MADIKSHATLGTSLTSYWDLEEASGTRYDLHGSNDLTDVNTVGQNTGKVGNCANFVHANAECFSSTNNMFGGQAKVSGAMWIYPTSHGTYTDMYYGEYESTGNHRGLLFYRNNESPHNGLLQIDVSGDGTTSNFQIYRTDQAECVTLNTWYHIAFVLDVVAETCTFYVNGSAVDSTKDSSTGSITTINSSASNTFYVASWDDDGTYHYNDGRIDEAGIWYKELTSGEVSDLYNSGDGLPYYDPTDIKNDTDLSTSLVSYWEMEQSAGATAVDSHGSNDLSDNGTVGTATGILGEGADYEESSSQYHSITDASQTGLDFTAGDVSFSAWVKFESFADGLFPIYAKSDGSGSSGGIHIHHWDTSDRFRIQFYKAPSGFSRVWWTWAPSLSTWYHIVVVVDLDSVGSSKLYINGVDQGAVDGTDGSSATGTNNNSEPALIGRYETASAVYADGVIDEMGIWSKVLGVDEVRALYGYGTPPVYDAGGGGGAAVGYKNLLTLGAG